MFFPRIPIGFGSCICTNSGVQRFGARMNESCSSVDNMLVNNFNVRFGAWMNEICSSVDNMLVNNFNVTSATEV